VERESMKNITIRLESELIEELKKRAIKDNRSLSSLIRLILKKGIGASEFNA
jgi:predicted DNA binding CopG/RHH family protein